MHKTVLLSTLTLLGATNLRFASSTIVQQAACSGKGASMDLSSGTASSQKNVFGEDLQLCSIDPMTGYFRTGCCETGQGDSGVHTVCAVLTNDFLEYTKAQGNDLSTPRPQYGFPGLKAGDRWCLCALRWHEAFKAGKAPLVQLKSTNIKTLKLVPLEDLLTQAIDPREDKKDL